MPKDNQGAYAQLPNPNSATIGNTSSQFDVEDDFEMEDEDNLRSTRGSFPQELDIESINNFKNSFPNVPSTPRGPIGHINKIFGGKRRKFILYVGALIIIFLLGSLFVRFQSPGTGNDDHYKNVDSTEPESKPISSDPISPLPDAPEPDTSKSDRIPLTMADLNKGALSVRNKMIKFINPEYATYEVEDQGLYYHFDELSKELKVVKVEDLEFKTTLASSLKFTYDGKDHRITKVIPNLDLTYSILATDVFSEFRHSSKGFYWIYQHQSGNIYPVILDEFGELLKISFASWSPKYNYVSFVKDNNLYLKKIDSLENTQVTFDGSETVFYGKPDWVYEEEVLASDRALWWAPDESKLVFLKLDDSHVELYELQYYAKQNEEEGYNKYPVTKKLSYPKPGGANPQASLHVYTVETDEIMELDRPTSTLGDDFIVYDAFFLNNENFIIKETDRVSNVLHFRNYNVKTEESSVFHEIDSGKEYNGWIERQGKVLTIPTEQGETEGFVDVQTVNGFNHLVYFEDITKGPVSLTSGNWEVNKDSLGYNPSTKEVYYFSNEGSSMDQHLYSVNLATKKKTMLKLKESDDAQNGGFYSGSFSSHAKYAHINYEGPDVPYSMIYNLESNEMVLSLTSDQEIVKENLEEYLIPSKKLHRIQVDTDSQGNPVELNVIESKPFNFDPKKKYPLLVHYYGGPGFQVVYNKFEYGFEETVCSALDAVVLYIEPRGTGGQGWSFRSWAKRKIGYWEPRDIKTVTEQWVNDENSFIDKEKVAVWGWSYGGFTTLNTLQYDAGEVFKYGVAVAPVTDWRLYDSIYTERYMDKPEDNEEGYDVSQISNFDNLKKVPRFLVMHGSADDNVHLQNSMILMDEFDLNGLSNYEMKIWPDSDHSISFHNANSLIYDKIFKWFQDAFQGRLEGLQSKK